MGNHDMGNTQDYLSNDEARANVLKFIERVAGPRADGAGVPEIRFARDVFNRLIPWDALGQNSKSLAKRATQTLRKLEEDLCQQGIIIAMFWHEDPEEDDG